MLSESSISRISLALSVIGLLAVLAFSQLEQPLILKISEVENFPERRISLSARIASASFAKNTLFLKLYDGNFLNAVFFNPPENVLEFSEKGVKVSAVGILEKQSRGNSFIISRLEKHD